MKIKNIFLFSALLLAFSLAFTACEESDDYDYNAIEPIVQGINGPAAVRGGTTIAYRAIGRGGSTFNFTSEGAVESITPIEGEPYGIMVEYKESFDDATAVISVVETTQGGKASPKLSLEIAVAKLAVNITGDSELAVIEGQPVTKTYALDFLYPGATYAWTLEGDNVSIEGPANGTSVVVKFDYPEESEQNVKVKVEVTTRKGNKILDDHAVKVLQFCPLVIEEMIADWVGSVSLAGGDCPQEATVASVDAATNTIHMTGFADFLVVCNWGEDWIDGDGTVKVKLQEPAGLVTIPLQWIGESNYPDHYWVRGVAFAEGAAHHGVYNFCGPIITVKFNVAYGGEPDENGLPVDADDLVWIFATPPTSTFTLATDAKGNTVLRPLTVSKK
ncbi:MAG: hypothetical protein ACK4VN_07585 [Bacteroidales bacterium]